MSLRESLNLRRFFKGEGPESGTIVLSQRKVFILPSRAGIIFVLILFAMFLAAINYNNSLAYLLTFLLTSVAIVSILHCHRNLQGIELRCAPPEAGFAKQSLSFPIYLYNPSARERIAIKLGWPHQPPQICDLAPESGHWLQLKLAVEKRGWQVMPRLTLYSRYPLGLFHVWSHIHFDNRALVYPQAVGNHQLPLQSTASQGSEGTLGRGSNDFAGQRPYHAGDSMRHINWRALARERGLLTKQFTGNQSEQLILDWQQLDNLPLELKLSQLCLWVIEAHRANLQYGLQLPNQQLPINSGVAHYQQCLKLLALYGEAS